MVHVRRAAPEDAIGIAIVKAITWKTTYAGLLPDAVIDSKMSSLRASAEKCRSDIRQHDNFIIAVEETTIVGFCVYGTSRNPDFADSGEIFALYVLKGLQGKGTGKALFLAAVSALLLMRNTTMILNCLHGNPSLGFYQYMGGRVVGQRQDIIDGASITEDIVYYDDLRQLQYN